jgi:DNA-binding XRE family transcriptional regulator
MPHLSRDQRNLRRKIRYQKNRQKILETKKIKYASRTEDQKKIEAEKRKIRTEEIRQEKIKQYLSDNENPPTCLCGCGQYVNFNRHGKPNKYCYNHFKSNDSRAQEAQFAGQHRIPTEKVRQALEKLRIKHGWSIQQMAKLGGVSKSTLWSILRDPNYAKEYGVDAEMIRCLLRRLSGIREPLSNEEYAKINSRYRQTEPKDFS